MEALLSRRTDRVVPRRNRTWIDCAGLALGLSVSSSAALAQDSFVAKTETYTDSDHTTVVRPSLSATKDLSSALGWNVRAGAAYSVDVITTASVDVVTQATVPEFEDRRQEAEGSLTYSGSEGLEVGASYTYSTEADYKSRAVSVRAARDFAGRSITLSGRVGVVQDDVLHILDTSFEESLDGVGYMVAVSRPLTPRLVWRGGYEGARFSGYMQSPYRAVRFGDGTARLERHPDERLRHSIFAGAAWHLGGSSAVQPQYTFYADDWGVESHEIDLQYLFEPTDGVILRTRYRLYLQSAADFYEERYIGLPETYRFWTVDKRLGRMIGHLAGIRVQYKLPGPRTGESFGRVGIDAKLDLIRNEYPEFQFLDHRTALVLQFGISTDY
jgi:hypothetical protein